MRKSLLLICLLFILKAGTAQNNSTVFLSGTEGYKSFRIPAILKLKNGDLLAFCEGRVKGAADFGNVDIVMRKSSNRGKTWGTLKKLVDADELQAGNPAPVLDLTDPLFPKGRIFLFYNTGNNHEGEIRKGNGKREVWYIYSEDGGEHWSAAVNITAAVKDSNWRSYANTPGHAMQIRYGPYAGRIYVAANHSAGPPQKQFMDYRSHGYYSDDHGKSFHLSESVDFDGSNEATAAEGLNGELILNMRNQKGDPRFRLVARSKDGGIHWEDIHADTSLPDPVCEGAILNLNEKGRGWLAFSNPANQKERNDLTLRISNDAGKTWFLSIPIYRSEKGEDPSAYSDLVDLNRKQIGILFEKDNYSSIEYRVINY